MNQPPRIENEEHLEDLLSEPSPAALEALSRVDGDIVILGVGGKMGPSLARMARRAAAAAGSRRRIIGVARFSRAGLEAQLRGWGIDTLHCDLLDSDQVNRLPDAANVIAMTGMKFGTTGQEALTWAMNAHVPALIASKYRQSRIVAFSTGNVYGLSPVRLGGALETDSLHPVGEYSQSCLARERMYQYFAGTFNMPMALLRLNYATEMRYGVLADLARKVRNDEPVDLTMGHVNVIWQADANAMALCALAHAACPPLIVNLAGPELLSVRHLAAEFGRIFERPAIFHSEEAGDAYVSNGQLGYRLFGYPRVSAHQMIEWVADWVRRGGVTLDKPTHFEVRDGKF
jgi:dTDP-4-dehydrorhamnose reductase